MHAKAYIFVPPADAVDGKAGVIVGSAIGAFLALRIEMTAMPQMVALLNGFGGGASTLVASAELLSYARGGATPEGVVPYANGPGALTGAGTLPGRRTAPPAPPAPPPPRSACPPAPPPPPTGRAGSRPPPATPSCRPVRCSRSRTFAPVSSRASWRLWLPWWRDQESATSC